MGGKHHRLLAVLGRYLAELLDEDRAARLEPFHDIAIMHDLVTHIDGRAVALQRQHDDLDRPVDAGAEPARRAQHDVEARQVAHGVHSQ